MSFDIQIRVDPGDSAAKIKGVTDGLTQAEQRGKAAGEAMLGVGAAFKSVAQAMQQEQTALSRTNQLHSQLQFQSSAFAGSLNGVAAAIQREREMLESIHGPAQRLAQDTQTLDSLMAKGAITATEYSQALARAKSTAGGGGGNSPTSTNLLASQFGFGGIGSAAGLVGGTAVGVMAVRELAEIDDKYNALRNSAQRFVEAGHNVDQVLADQRQLSRDLHLDMSESMQAYALVKEANDGVNLSYEDTIRLDKTLSEAAQLNDRSTQDLAQQMQNLRVALETGADASRPLRTIFKEFPELQKQWTTATGLTEKQLYDLARSGQLSYDTLARASITATDAIDAKFGQRVKLWGTEWKELSDTLEQPINPYAMLDELDATKKATDEILRQAKALQDQTGLWATLGTASHKYADATIGDLDQVATAFGAIGAKMHEIAGFDPWAGADDKTGLLAFFPAGTKAAMEYAASVGEAKKKLADLNAAHATGAINAEAYRKQWESLTTAIDGRLPAAYVQLHQIIDPTVEFKRNIAGLNEDYADGSIRLDQYTAKLKQLSDAYAGSDVGKLFEQLRTPGTTGAELAAHQQALIAQSQGDLAYASGSIAPMTQTQQAAERYRLELAQLNDMIERGVVDQDEANNRLAQYHEELNKATGAVDEQTKRQHDMEAMLIKIKKPQYDYQYGLSLLNEMLADGAIKQGEYNAEVSALQLAYDATQKNSTDFVTGLAHGWDDIKKSTTDTAHTIESAFKSAFDNLNNTLADFFTKGTADWSKFASSIESDLVKLALQTAEGSIISSLAPTPHFATGGSGYVGGSGGTDSQLFIAKVTPGEHFQFTPPGQAVDARKGGSSSSGGHTIVNLNYDPRAIRSGRDIQTGVMATLKNNAAASRLLLDR